MQHMNDQKSTSYTRIYNRIMTTTVILLSAKVSYWKWMDHSTHYLSSWNETPYPLKTSRNWKLQRK